MICKFDEPQDQLREVTAGLEQFDQGELKDNLVISKVGESIFNDFENEEMDVSLGVAESAHAFEVSLDVTGFQTEDLTVLLQENQVIVTGLHQEISLDGTRRMEHTFERKYTMPDHIDREKVKSSVTADGRVLKIVAPFLPQKASVELEEEKVTVRTITTRRG